MLSYNLSMFGKFLHLYKQPEVFFILFLFIAF